VTHTLTRWAPIAARAVTLPEWDARAAFLRLQDAADVRLTLGVREEIQGRTLRCQDGPGGSWWCAECLADLPADLLGQLGHECGADPAVGDLVWVLGEVPAGYGRLYEIGAAGPILRLYDCGNALDVPRHAVTVVRRAEDRHSR
jgi:hypothetical protein